MPNKRSLERAREWWEEWYFAEKCDGSLAALLLLLLLSGCGSCPRSERPELIQGHSDINTGFHPTETGTLVFISAGEPKATIWCEQGAPFLAMRGIVTSYAEDWLAAAPPPEPEEADG